MRPHDFIRALLLLGSVATAFTSAAAQMPAVPDSALDVPSGSDPTFDVPPDWTPRAPAPPPPLAPQGFTPPATLTQLVSTEPQYPPESFRLREQGIVRSRFLLTETGEVTECTIESTSGYARLDEAACGLVARWKYAPKSDGGKAVTHTVTVNHVYQLFSRSPVAGGSALNVPQTSPLPAPEITTNSPVTERFTPAVTANSHLMTADDYPADSIRMQEQGRIGLVFIVNEVGDVSECAVDSSSGYARLDAAACSMVVRRWKYKPATLDGKATAMLATANVVFNLR